MNIRLKVPEILEDRFGVPPTAGRRRALPRVWMGYKPPKPPRMASSPSELDRRRRPPRKAILLGTMWGLTIAGALPGDGDRKDWRRKRVSQYILAKMTGISRSAYTRRLSRFANQHGRRPDPRRDPTYRLISRKRNFGRPNDYGLGEHLPPEASRPRRKQRELYSYPSATDLASHPQTGALFDPDGPAGYGLVPLWVWHPNLPVSESARIVMSFYVTLDLLEKGEIHPRQSTVSEQTGLNVRTVYRANQEWAAIGILRIAHPKPEVLADGSLRRGPQIVLYLPARTLTREEAALEARRLQSARYRLLADQQRWWKGVEAVHAKLLHEWTGKEHSLGAFHNALQRELEGAGVPGGVIAVLIPRLAPDSS